MGRGSNILKNLTTWFMDAPFCFMFSTMSRKWYFINGLDTAANYQLFLLRIWLSSQGHRFHIKMLIYITLKIYKSQLSKTNVASFFVETNNIISFWTFSHFMMYLTLQRMKKIAIISPLSIRYGADSTLQFSQKTLNTRDKYVQN